MTEKNLVTNMDGQRSSPVSTEDSTLLRELGTGSSVAFDRLYERYRPRIFAFLLRMTGRRALSEDLLQEVFLRLASKASTLPKDTSVRGWLFTVARNAVISHMRWRAAQSRNLEAYGAEEGERASFTPQHAMEFSETHARLEAALAGLAPKHREVLLLVAVEGLSPSEAAAVIGIKGEALRQRLSRARQEMSLALAETPSTTSGRKAQ